VVDVTYRITNIQQCIRCGSSDLVEGKIIQSTYDGESRKRVLIDYQDFFVNSRICRSCGHIEEFVHPHELRGAVPGKNRACPKCDAVYSYKKKHEVSEGVVRCQNCGVEFHLSVQIECPHCSAAYLYSMEKTSANTVVPCQNCGKTFLLTADMELVEDIKST
jgi:predicted Zn finger-like uncharacterized protein